MDLELKLKADRQPMTAPEMIEAAAHLSRRLREIADMVRNSSTDGDRFTIASSDVIGLESIADALELFGEDIESRPGPKCGSGN